MEVQRLGREYAAEYWELRLEALRENPEAFLTTYQAALTKESPVDSTAKRLEAVSNYTYGAYMNRQLVGVVTMLRKEQEKVAHKADILAMYVTPSARGNGVGHELLQRAKRDAAEIGVEQLGLSVVADNLAAQHLYKKAGFTCYGKEKNAIKQENKYVDEVHMVCFLLNEENKDAENEKKIYD
ncbi:GNAT family N-acetyltransferase [Sediminibacillus halophilus]|uniref:Acetyltransferase (GNAT) domain-containing protein n=1 Tax=Sediminibacillus halophilus TaxID=482461 RepID=A0A1G9PSH1_9BACI|nr:GNAT family N-acetyltransferase [Sediminibacillus halophilus]SDM01718.1 Acetyltransferase (GNAT) domain-containing protein [Sediminibacillus halophilus]